MLLATTRTIIQSVLDLFAIFQEIRPQQKPKQQSHQLLRSLLRRLPLLLFDKTYKKQGQRQQQGNEFSASLANFKNFAKCNKISRFKDPCIVYHLCNQETTWSTLVILQFLASHEDNYQNATVTCQGSSILKHFCPQASVLVLWRFRPSVRPSRSNTLKPILIFEVSSRLF